MHLHSDYFNGMGLCVNIKKGQLDEWEGASGGSV